MDSHIIADWAQAFGSAVTALAFILALYQLRLARRAQREASREALEAKQVEIYQRLEIESNAVFQFEAANKTVVPLFKTHLAPPDALTRGDAVNQSEARLIARKYYEICCNLFEIAARLKRHGYVPDEVFGSWVAWYFDTLCEWGFRALWADLRDNYTVHLRESIFDPFVHDLIRDWDMPHAASPRPDLCMPPETVEALRTKFYAHIGEVFECDTVTNWLSEVRAAPILRHPLAFK